MTKLFGVQPEVAAENELPKENAEENGNAENLPMARPMFDEMNSRIAGEFGQLAEKLGQFEAERRALSRRLWRMFAFIFFFFILALLLLGFCAYYLYGEIGKQNTRTTAEIAQKTQKYELLQQESELRRRKAEADARKQMDQFSIILDKNRADFQKNLDKLTEELSSQRKAYQQNLQQLANAPHVQAELELRKAREDFAKQQLEKLKELSQRQERIDALQKQKSEQEKEIAALKKRLTELEKQLAAPTNAGEEK